MNDAELKEIVACLPRGRTVFYYFPDRYALLLLGYFVGEGMSVREVKKSQFAGFLKKPLIKNALQRLGDRPLSLEFLESLWSTEPECYVLTLGRWGRSALRRGKHHAPGARQPRAAGSGRHAAGTPAKVR